MDVILAFIRAIPSAAASPLALIAYLATLVAWAIIAYRVNRFRELMKRIELLPEGDRLAAIKAEIGRVDVPRGLTGEQYLRMRILPSSLSVSLPSAVPLRWSALRRLTMSTSR